MNNEYRYILDKSSKKHSCPGCGKMSLVWYIDIETKQFLPENYGRCDREINCSYHLNPYKDGYFKGLGNSSTLIAKVPQVMQAMKSEFIPATVLRQTLNPEGYDNNVFLQNLLHNVTFPFDESDIERVVALYFLGSVDKGYGAGAITFPFIDNSGKVRAIQVKRFNQANHTTSTNFIHSLIEKEHQQKHEPLPDWLTAYKKNERKVSCLFGEHLLKKYQYNPIALVEAPKTAIYGTLYFGFPDDPESLLWVAVYNLSSLTFEKCRALKGRHIYLFPDLSKDGMAFNLWSRKAKELTDRMPGTLFKVSDLLEQKASETERLDGLDLADFLIKQDWRKFRTQLIPESEKGENSETPRKTFSSHGDSAYNSKEWKLMPKNWRLEITELEHLFSTMKLPSSPFQLNQCTKIVDIKKFIESNIAYAKAHNGNKTFRVYLDQLQELRDYLLKHQN